MKNKSTEYAKGYSLSATLLSSLFLLLIIAILIYILMNTKNLLVIIVFSFFLIFIFYGLIRGLIGIIKAKREVIKEKKYIKRTNPYIYYKELPNTFGIGIASLLFNSKIENYKDIIAVILDLCARKYLTLIKQNDKYIIKVLKNIDNNLLNNEKYILNLIVNNDIKNINYHEWYNYCMQDGINLGLYYHTETKQNIVPLITDSILEKRRKSHLKISIILAILIFILYILEGSLLEAFGYAILWFIITYVILIIPFYVINLFTVIKNVGKQTSDMNYQTIMNNHLKKTKKGIDELQKLYSFKAFLNDFGHFVDKRPNEVILWDRYLSYAQVFGLTKEIMNSGYKELIDNSSFQIDNLDNITLSNIEVNKK